MNERIYVYFLKVPTLEEILDYTAFLIKEFSREGKLIDIKDVLKNVGDYLYSHYKEQIEEIVNQLKIKNQKVAVISPYLSTNLKNIWVIEYQRTSPDSEIIKIEKTKLGKLDKIVQDLLKEGYVLAIQSPRSSIRYLDFIERSYKAVGLFYTSFFFILGKVLYGALRRTKISREVVDKGKYPKLMAKMMPLILFSLSTRYKDILDEFIYYGIPKMVLRELKCLEKDREPSDQTIKRIVGIYKEGIYKNTIDKKKIGKIREFLGLYSKTFEKIIDLAKGIPIINVY